MQKAVLFINASNLLQENHKALINTWLIFSCGQLLRLTAAGAFMVGEWGRRSFASDLQENLLVELGQTLGCGTRTLAIELELQKLLVYNVPVRKVTWEKDLPHTHPLLKNQKHKNLISPLAVR